MRALLTDGDDTTLLQRGAAGAALIVALGAAVVIWLIGASNPFTPAGYVGYLTKGAVIGHSRFYGVQRGPTSAGRTWLLDVTNVSITPYTYTEDFSKDDSVLSRDNLKIAFQVHTVWHVDDAKIRSSWIVSARPPPTKLEKILTRSSRSPMATSCARAAAHVRARDEVQRRNGLKVKDALIPIGDAGSR
jgi:hypothetical protein